MEATMGWAIQVRETKAVHQDGKGPPWEAIFTCLNVPAIAGTCVSCQGQTITCGCQNALLDKSFPGDSHDESLKCLKFFDLTTAAAGGSEALLSDGHLTGVDHVQLCGILAPIDEMLGRHVKMKLSLSRVLNPIRAI